MTAPIDNATEAPQTAAPDATAEGSQDQPTTEAPPWGDDFDPARAWQTICHLRDEVRAAKAAAAEAAERAAEAPEEAAPDGNPGDAPSGPEEGTDDATKALADRVAAAERDAAEARRALWVERALRKYDVPDDLHDLVTGDTEEAVTAIAERLAGRTRPTKAPAADDMPRRPDAALTPGHGGEAPKPFDPDALAARARRARH